MNEPELEPLLRQVFGVSQTGVDVLVHIIENETVRTDDIATDLALNRSTVNRRLAQLRELGVVECTEQTLDGGGQVYLYSPVSPAVMRQRHREGFLSWVTDAFDLLGEIDEQKLKAAAERRSPSDESRCVPGDE